MDKGKYEGVSVGVAVGVDVSVDVGVGDARVKCKSVSAEMSM